jgi:hypothetical protein
MIIIDNFYYFKNTDTILDIHKAFHKLSKIEKEVKLYDFEYGIGSLDNVIENTTKCDTPRLCGRGFFSDMYFCLIRT